jgi:NAD(P) transhydrogenase subunit beta
MPMTAVPQRTAISHAFGALAVALVGTAEYYQAVPHIYPFTMAVLAAEMILGYLTFTGSLLAFAKLQELISGKPLVYPGRRVVSFGALAVALGTAAYLVLAPGHSDALPILIGAALVFGVLLVLSIGGADMPTVIAILNSYAGLSAAGLGFVLNNKLLIVAGALDGASGFILAVLMCKAMNRSFANVLFGGVGGAVRASPAGAYAVARPVQSFSPDDAADLFAGAPLVVIAPGYGLAVAQAQHAVKELADALQRRGCDVKFAIHPVAGRMPGHMNVLLAEAQVPYDQLWEMDRVNPLLPAADVAIVVGANDVTNPAARTRADSPLYGMPVLDVDKARTILFCKRGMAPGFSGVDNELFYNPKTWMLFGDAKDTILRLTASLKGNSGLH